MEFKLKYGQKQKLVGDVTETRHTVLGIVKYIHNIKISI